MTLPCQCVFWKKNFFIRTIKLYFHSFRFGNSRPGLEGLVCTEVGIKTVSGSGAEWTPKFWCLGVTGRRKLKASASWKSDKFTLTGTLRSAISLHGVDVYSEFLVYGTGFHYRFWQLLNSDGYGTPLLQKWGIVLPCHSEWCLWRRAIWHTSHVDFSDITVLRWNLVIIFFLSPFSPFLFNFLFHLGSRLNPAICLPGFTLTLVCYYSFISHSIYKRDRNEHTVLRVRWAFRHHVLQRKNSGDSSVRNSHYRWIDTPE